jgi:hypothetical protein
MTANELADKLIGSLTMEYDCDKYMEQAATMLRQQAKEIEVLKQRLELAKWYEETDEQVIANAEKRFPFLKKASEK